MDDDAAALLEEDATNVLFGDGRVDWLQRDAFEKAVERARQIDPKIPQIPK